MDTSLIIKLIGVATIANAITWAKPARLILELFDLAEEVPARNPWTASVEVIRMIDPRPIFQWCAVELHILLRELFSCSLCISFWIGLLTFGDFWMAAISMFATKIVDSIHANSKMNI